MLELCKTGARHARNTLNTGRCFYRMICYGGRLRGGFLFVLTLSLVGVTNSNDGSYAKPLTAWKTHLSKVFNSKELQFCLEIIRLESNGNYRATNGSHYGLIQGRSKYLKDLNPIQQIDWFTEYLEHRYQGSCAVALRHHRAKGWY